MKEPMEKKLDRRDVLKALIAGSSAVAASVFLPAKWIKPVVKMGVLPAHAQVSCTTTFTAEGPDGSYVNAGGTGWARASAIGVPASTETLLPNQSGIIMTWQCTGGISCIIIDAASLSPTITITTRTDTYSGTQFSPSNVTYSINHDTGEITVGADLCSDP